MSNFASLHSGKLIAAALVGLLAIGWYLGDKHDEERREESKAYRVKKEAQEAARLKQGAVLVSKAEILGHGTALTLEVPFKSEYFFELRTCVVFIGARDGKSVVTCPSDAQGEPDQNDYGGETLACPDPRYC